MPQRAMSGNAHLGSLAPGLLYTASEEHRNDGESLATLRCFDRPRIQTPDLPH